MKEKLKELFKNKKFIFGIVIWVVVAIYLVSCIIFTAKNVYAYDMVDTGLWTTDERELTLTNGDTVTIYNYNSTLSEYPYLVIAYDKVTNSYDYVYSKTKYGLKTYNDMLYVYYYSDDWLIYEYVEKDGKYSLYRSMNKQIYLNSTKSEVLFSNYDLCNDSGECFFKVAPTVPTITQTGLTGAKITEKTIAVIGLLIPLLIVSVVGFLAFRKGWKFLVTNLKRA